MRNGLMGLQVAMALVVLMAALFVRSFNETRDIDPGFRREGVLLGAYDLSNRNLDGAAARTFATRLLRRLKDLPSVESAAIASSVPLDIHGLPLRAFSVEGRPRDDKNPDRALSNLVTPGYFQTMGVPIVSGRDFADFEDSNTPPQAIVNQEFVRRFANGVEVIGRTVQTRGGTYAIAGVVRNSISESFGEAPTPIVYLSYRDRPSLAGEIHVRTRAGAETLLAPELQRSFAISIRRCRFTTSGRLATTSKESVPAPHTGLACLSSSVRFFSCLRRSASTRWLTSPSRGGRPKSASAWRWVRPSGM
jgi:hypothetical protein